MYLLGKCVLLTKLLYPHFRETPTSVQILVAEKKTLVDNPTKIVAGAGLWRRLLVVWFGTSCSVICPIG